MDSREIERTVIAYTARRIGLFGAAERLGCGRSKARRILAENGAKIHGRGRPSRQQRADFSKAA